MKPFSKHVHGNNAFTWKAFILKLWLFCRPVIETHRKRTIMGAFILGALSLAQRSNFHGHLSTLQLHVEVIKFLIEHFFIILWILWFVWNALFCVFGKTEGKEIPFCALKHHRSSLLWQVFLKSHWSLNKFWSSWRLPCIPSQLCRSSIFEEYLSNSPQNTDKVFCHGMEGKSNLNSGCFDVQPLSLFGEDF